MILRVVLLLLLFSTAAFGRDLGQWESTDPAVRSWYQSLMMPDIPTASCCGEADAYWCDEVHVRNGKTYCNITDDRDDALLHRISIPLGTEIEIPDYKLTWKDGNPTGHSIVFLSRGLYVYCFVQSSGT